MPRIVTLSRNGVSASLAPETGGLLLSLAIDGVNILRPAVSPEDASRDPRGGACFPCVPYFSRLPAAFDFAGERHSLAPTLPACDPARPIHGEGWVSPWEITAQTEDFLACRYSHAPAPERFPFPFAARQDFALSGRGLSICLAVENVGNAPAPAGLGLHPYFPRHAETRLTFAAAGFWTPLPGGGEEGPVPENLNFAAGARLPETTLDHSFTGFAGEALIENGDMSLRLRSGAPILHVYAPQGRDYFCLEPVTHRPGRFGGDVLAPGETLRLSITVEAARD